MALDQFCKTVRDIICYSFRAEFLHRQKMLDGILKENANADLVFLVDCTSSMKPYIETTKSQIQNIVAACVEEFENQVKR